MQGTISILTAKCNIRDVRLSDDEQILAAMAYPEIDFGKYITVVFINLPQLYPKTLFRLSISYRVVLSLQN